ncbi:MAG: hypothetical protein CSA23_03030 [Deltaproteobacteria bacterium]|nr:MAG: hypothetical protein CSA23_03030 [Deltaproteobacteria bacterium]
MTASKVKLYTAVLLAALILLIACISVMSAVPPVSRDALTHHLAVPKIWIEAGLFKELPSIPFSYYPMNLDLLYLLPLLWDNDIIPKYIHFSFALLTAFLIYRHLERQLGQVYGLLGALFFLSIPIIVKLSTIVYVDLGLICFSTAALLALINWIENRYATRYLIISALFCGLALGTKYNGLIVFFLMSCMVPLSYLRRHPGNGHEDRIRTQLKALGFGLLFMIVALVVFSPWMIKNLRMTGNPVYPLYNGLFHSNANDTRVETKPSEITAGRQKTDQPKSKWSNFAIRKMVYGESLIEIALIPVRVFFEGVDDNPRHFDGRLNPFLLILPLCLIPLARRRHNSRHPAYWILSSFAIAYLIFVFVKQDMRIRWIGPIIPPLVILGMYALAGMRQLAATTHKKWVPAVIQVLIIVSLVIMFAWNAVYIQTLFRKVDAIPYILGRVDRDTYIARFRPEYALIRHIDTHFSEEVLILGLFIGDRIYYFDRDIRLNKNVLFDAVTHAGSAEDIGRNLNRRGITHLLLRFDLTQSWISRVFVDQEKTRLKTYFQKHVKPIAQNGGYGLFELSKVN